jgi:hypothetical protein
VPDTRFDVLPKEVSVPGQGSRLDLQGVCVEPVAQVLRDRERVPVDVLTTSSGPASFIPCLFGVAQR